MRILRARSMVQALRGQQATARGRRTATCPPSRPGPATSNHPLPVPGREQGDATVFTKQKRKERVRTAAMAAAMGFLVIAAFEAALTLGAPLGRATMGGFYEGQLPMSLRIVAGVAVG